MTIITIAAPLNIKCNYDNIFFWVADTIYSCELEGSLEIFSEKIIVNAATGYHKDFKNDNDVLGLKVEHANIQYFPKGLEKIFNNIKLFWIEFCKLKEIFQSDLTPHPNLEFLFLGHNDIEILEKDLFKFHPRMKAISFWNCKIFHIHPNVFDNLLSLRELWLPRNQCIDMKSNPISVIDVIGVVKTKCQSPAFLRLTDKVNKLNQQAEDMIIEINIIKESCGF